MVRKTFFRTIVISVKTIPAREVGLHSEYNKDKGLFRANEKYERVSGWKITSRIRRSWLN